MELVIGCIYSDSALFKKSGVKLFIAMNKAFNKEIIVSNKRLNSLAKFMKRFFC